MIPTMKRYQISSYTLDMLPDGLDGWYENDSFPDRTVTLYTNLSTINDKQLVQLLVDEFELNTGLEYELADYLDFEYESGTVGGWIYLMYEPEDHPPSGMKFLVEEKVQVR